MGLSRCVLAGTVVRGWWGGHRLALPAPGGSAAVKGTSLEWQATVCLGASWGRVATGAWGHLCHRAAAPGWIVCFCFTPQITQ